ncbi:MAG: cytochrome c biogenesis protein ResB [Deltaproteobacteria bacterium]|nr:cytochrome c biogenesis protein ResB [Deltaproteobacteria bacterium]
MFRSEEKKGLTFWSSIVFHISMMVIVAVFSIAELTQFDAMALLPQDVDVDAQGSTFVTVAPSPLARAVPAINLRMEWLKTKYDEGNIASERDAMLHVNFVKDGEHFSLSRVIGVNRPAGMEGYQFMLIGGGVTPLFKVRDKDGKVLFEQYIKISEDFMAESPIDMPGSGLYMQARFFPDLEERGQYTYGTKSLGMNNPAFGLRIVDGREPFKEAWRGVLKPGEKARIGNLTLEFADLKQIAIVRITSDTTYWSVFSMWVLVMSALVIRYGPGIFRPERN